MFTHMDDQGQARMVDIGAKAVTAREALAEGFISMPTAVLSQLDQLPKGNAYQVARLAGILAAKRTDQLIPLCHSVPLDQVEIEFEAQPEHGRLAVRACARCQSKTGVEMEALMAVSLALLTIYDMAKSAARDMTIQDVRLLSKKGGKSGTWVRENT